MIELFNLTHIRNQFDCGIPALNDYLKNQAGQDMRRKLSACFILSNKPSEILGYYTLSNYNIPLSHFPEKLRKKLLPAYTSLPVTLLGRLAISESQQGRGFGRILLIDALKRSYEAFLNMGSVAVVVDPINTEAAAFYQNYGFDPLPDSGKMMIEMKTLGELFGEG